MGADTRHYHGGKGGYRKGDIIVPDPDDATDIAVEVHTERNMAKLAAAGIGSGGALYQIEPLGPVGMFKGDRVGFAPKARVIAVIDAVVRPTRGELARLYRSTRSGT